MTVQNEDELRALRKIGHIVALVLKKMQEHAQPGMSTAELDEYGESLLLHVGARSAPQLVYDFPGATCISVNEEVAHGIPGERILRAGDTVNIDVSAELDGYFADTGGTFALPPISEIQRKICYATHEALHDALDKARAGYRINAIGRAIEKRAAKHGFTTIRNLAGHGVGRALHEEPVNIVSYYEARDNRRLSEGMVVAIEPFLSTQCTAAEQADDGWTLMTSPGNLSAQYEHTAVITRGKPLIMTAL
ncbi:MAG: type I methionyl aminopeptidase [Pseudomonadota bacterium]